MFPRRLLHSAIIAAAAIVLTFPLMGSAASTSPATMKAKISVISPTALVGKTIQPGNYTVVVSGNKAKFERYGKTVADVSCTLTTLKQKAQHDAAYMNGGRLTEIRFAGKTEAAKFPAKKAS